MKRPPALLFLLLFSAPAIAAETWLCVGCPDYLAAARPLVEHRRAEGLTVHTSSAAVPQAVKDCPQRPDYILILGDEIPDAAAATALCNQPSARRPFHGWKASHPKEFATDMAYGDFDGDGMPDAVTGRLPARSVDDVRAGVAKILHWEQREPSLADLSLPVWAGDPGFTPLFRDMALGFLFRQIRSRAPLWAELWVMQGDERSPFCGWPLSQPSDFNSRLARGSLISAMIGHGRRSGWWSMDLDGQRLDYTTRDSAAQSKASPSAPHVIFACECGSFNLPDRDGLAESLFRAPGGPVLCVGATEDSHPLTNYYHSTALLSALATASPRFGTVWLHSLRAAASANEPDKEALVHNLLEPLFIRTKLKTEDIRADHQMLYNLIGDPATRFHSPAPLDAEFTVTGGGIEWNVPHPPPGARLIVQHRSPLPEFSLSARAKSKKEANRRRQTANTALSFTTTAELPAGAAWKGNASDPGTLRLVAVTGQKIYATAAEVPGQTKTGKEKP